MTPLQIIEELRAHYPGRHVAVTSGCDYYPLTGRTIEEAWIQADQGPGLRYLTFSGATLDDAYQQWRNQISDTKEVHAHG